MATTTNFGWETPDDTDLVKDGAAAIRTALGGVDTSLVDLKGGTTGQLLSKASNTDMDFTWAAAPTSGGMTSIASGTLSGASVSLTSIPGTYNELILLTQAVNTTTDDVYIGITLNSDTGATAYQRVFAFSGAQTSGSGNSSLRLFKTDNAVLTNVAYLNFPNYNSTSTYKMINNWAFGANASTTTTIDYFNSCMGWWANSTNAITSIQIAPESGTFEGGSYVLYGVK